MASGLPDETIARAVQLAAEEFEQTPEAVMAAAGPIRPRLVAIAALYHALDGVSYRDLAIKLNFNSPNSTAASVNVARKAKWWPELLVDAITGDLVADQYGERAL